MYHLIEAEISAGHLEQALHMLRNACTAQPRDAGLWSWAGTLHQQLQQYPEARRCFDKALTLAPNAADILCNFGAFHLLQGEPHIAMRYLKRAVQSEDTLAQAHFNLAEAASALGEFAQARQHYQRAVVLFPDYSAAEDGLRAVHQAWWQVISAGPFKLRRPVEQDASYIVGLWRDVELMTALNRNAFRYISPETWIKQLRDNQRRNPKQMTEWTWIVEHNQQACGLLTLTEIDFQHRRAEVQIGLEKAARGKGAGVYTMAAIARTFFEVLGMHRLSALVYADNAAPVSSLEGLGFQKEGVMRGVYFDKRLGQYLSIVHYAMLAEDYLSSSLHRVGMRLTGATGQNSSAPVSPSSNQLRCLSS